MRNSNYLIFLVGVLVNCFIWIIPSYASPPESKPFELSNRFCDSKSKGLKFIERPLHPVTKNLPPFLSQNETKEFIIVAKPVPEAPDNFKFDPALIRVENVGMEGSGFFSVACKDEKCTTFEVHGYTSNKIAYSWNGANPTEIIFCTKEEYKKTGSCPESCSP